MSELYNSNNGTRNETDCLFFGAPIYNTEDKIFEGTSSDPIPFKFVKYSDLSRGLEVDIYDLNMMEIYLQTFLITNMSKPVQPGDIKFKNFRWNFCKCEVFLNSSKPMIVFEYSCTINNYYYSKHKESFKLGILLDNTVETVPKTRRIIGLEDYGYNFTLSKLPNSLYQITFKVSENNHKGRLSVLSRVLPGGDLTEYRAIGSLDYLQSTIDNIKTVHSAIFLTNKSGF